MSINPPRRRSAAYRIPGVCRARAARRSRHLGRASLRARVHVDVRHHADATRAVVVADRQRRSGRLGLDGNLDTHRAARALDRRTADAFGARSERAARARRRLRRRHLRAGRHVLVPRQLLDLVSGEGPDGAGDQARSRLGRHLPAQPRRANRRRRGLGRRLGHRPALPHRAAQYGFGRRLGQLRQGSRPRFAQQPAPATSPCACRTGATGSR